MSSFAEMEPAAIHRSRAASSFRFSERHSSFCVVLFCFCLVFSFDFAFRRGRCDDAIRPMWMAASVDVGASRWLAANR